MASFALSDKKTNKQKKRKHNELISEIIVFVLHHIMNSVLINFPQIILMEDLMVYFPEKSINLAILQ